MSEEIEEYKDPKLKDISYNWVEFFRFSVLSGSILHHCPVVGRMLWFIYTPV